MAKKKDNGNGKSMNLSWKQETKNGVWAVIAFALALFFILSSFQKAGVAGIFFYNIFTALLGVGYFLLPVILILLGFSFARSEKPNIGWSHTLSAFLFLLSGLGIVDIISRRYFPDQILPGGYLGKIASFPFIKLFDFYVALIFLFALVIISLLLLFDAKFQVIPFLNRLGKILASILGRIFARREKAQDEEEAVVETTIEVSEEEPEEAEEEKPARKEKKKSEEPQAGQAEEEMPILKKHRGASAYVPPPLSLLEEDQGKPNVGDIKANSNIIKRTLQNFGIEVEMDEVTIGPSVTRYALKPAEGVKLSKILGLKNDLSLALAAHPLRIEAPIPGKSLVGIEIPNRIKSTVGLATLLKDEKFAKETKPLLVALGKNIAGRSTFGNLAKMPHLLIAGTTGSGKSVTIHAIITSLLYRNSPEELRYILIDPKRVELTLYNKVPHLLTPVITDPKKAILALRWAGKEMERRYDILEKNSVRDINSYHMNVLHKKGPGRAGKSEGEEAPPMPYIVIIIDELADIMTSYPRELEAAIVRLAQMSRAVGIHLILSTQRPSVNVITGLIKANVPARIALQVSSQIDSRTILDEGGAENLLGAGDMLCLYGEMSQPERLQSAFITESEVKKVVKYLHDNYSDEFPDMGIIPEVSGTGTGGNTGSDTALSAISLNGESLDEDDELYEPAKQAVMEAGKASTSYLQRKLKVGYARAARLIDMLEERGVVGPGEGAKPREVLIKGEGISTEENDEGQIS